MNLQEQFRSQVVTAAPDESLASVARLMRAQNVGAVVIVGAPGKPRAVAGIVTDRDLALQLGTGQARPETTVKEIMTKKVFTIWEDEGIFNATQYFLGHQVRRLPIVNRGGELVGMVTLDDLLGLLSRELFNVSRAVQPALKDEPGLPSKESIYAK